MRGSGTSMNVHDTSRILKLGSGAKNSPDGGSIGGGPTARGTTPGGAKGAGAGPGGPPPGGRPGGCAARAELNVQRIPNTSGAAFNEFIFPPVGRCRGRLFPLLASSHRRNGRPL